MNLNLLSGVPAAFHLLSQFKRSGIQQFYHADTERILFLSQNNIYGQRDDSEIYFCKLLAVIHSFYPPNNKSL